MLLPFIYLTISTYHHQIPNITNIGLTARKIKKAAIVGGGLMGSGIATILILNNFNVVLKEVNEQFLSAGINRIKGTLLFAALFFWNCLHSSSEVCSLVVSEFAKSCQKGSTYWRRLWKETFSAMWCSWLWTVQRYRCSNWGRPSFYYIHHSLINMRQRCLFSFVTYIET